MPNPIAMMYNKTEYIVEKKTFSSQSDCIEYKESVFDTQEEAQAYINDDIERIVRGYQNQRVMTTIQPNRYKSFLTDTIITLEKDKTRVFYKWSTRNVYQP